ncbi:hypothetical protein CLOLEP_01920 [[Clostridium] leptum DSM 753]|uniref:Uncharacterized protein n=1 Tax=[Clostridium] leptum DSM 753 TaxID=428125 RepID=A7VTM7_9FIRM|nr:hypothetical protein CLOLEP_01920 [[Clostridium] leptum DSM 753]
MAAVRLLQLIRKKNRGRPAVKNKSAKEKHTPYYGVCFICGGLPLVDVNGFEPLTFRTSSGRSTS